MMTNTSEYISRLSRPMSPMPDYSDDDASPMDNKTFVNGNLAVTNEIQPVAQINVLTTVENDAIDEAQNNKIENIEIDVAKPVCEQNGDISEVESN